MGSRSAAIGLCLGMSVCGAAVAQPACSTDEIWLRGEFGTARFSVEIADTAETRSRGLMFVEQMPRSQGMLFVYPQERPLAFWMKNTLIALDIIFADAKGQVVSVAANAIPHDETPLHSLGDAQFVLEINAGLAAQLGIRPGVEMRHPRIEDAAWPC